MISFLTGISTILTSLPGNLLYHALLVFLIAGTFLGAIQLLHSSRYPQVKRMVIGLGILLGVQILLYIVSGMAQIGVFDPKILLPPLDRAVTFLMLIGIIWLWAFPEPLKWGDYAALGLCLLTAALLGLTVFLGGNNRITSFNESIPEKIWQGSSLIVAGMGLLVVLIRKPNGWSSGLAMMILAFVGHLVSLVLATKGDFPGIVRLTQLAMFPILPMILQRFQIPAEARIPIQVLSETVGEGDTPVQKKFNADPETLHALMSLAAEIKTEQIGRGLVRSIAQVMYADLCFLLIRPGERKLTIACGYDLIREKNLEGVELNTDSFPVLSAAMNRGQTLRLPNSSTSRDLISLAQVLNLSQTGNLLCVPIRSAEGKSLGGILLLSPHSKQTWTDEDQNYLSHISDLFLPILERGQRASLLEKERNEAIRDGEKAQRMAEEEEKKSEESSRKMDELNAQLLQSQLRLENMTALLAAQEESQKTITALKSELEQLKLMGKNGNQAPDSRQLELELRKALEELARMQNKQSSVIEKQAESESKSASPASGGQMEMLASLAQELRQPMSSISGYADLLLGESVGILGALQRKFIERIKASTERINTLVDSLERMTSPEGTKMEFNAELVDLNSIIDQSMAATSRMIREKNITLRLDLSDISQVQTDRDALQQIFTHLLENAAAASQTEGVITLRVQMQREENENFLSFQITDSGGGIAATDLPRVFARQYRSEHLLIPGLGDAGVGLSIVKTLTEAQGGRIWVDSEPGVGSTFSVLLPVILEMEEEK